MSKFFPASARHVKAQEFLKLRQGDRTVLEYVAKFIELSRFGDDYVATDLAKVRRFEDGLKLSIRGKIVGFLIQNMDSMVTTAMAIERDIEDAQSIRDAGTGGKRKESQTSSRSGKKPKASSSQGFQGQGHGYQGQSQTRTPSKSEPITCYHCHQPRHMRRDFPQRQGSQGHGTPQSQSSIGHAQTQFLLTPVLARETSISPRVLHKHLLLHRRAREARVWVEVEDRAHKLGLQGPRGMSTSSYRRLSQRISRPYRVCFYYLAYGRGYYLIMVHRIPSLLHHV